MTDLLQNFAKVHDCAIGVCSPSPLPKEHYGFTPFVSRDINKRTNPAAILPGVKSIVVIGVGWSSSSEQKMADGHNVHTYPATQGFFFQLTSQSSQLNFLPPELSSLGTASDYHPKVKSILRQLVKNLPPHTKYKILVDSPGLDERAFAHRAGIGFFGRNGLIISPQFGSRFNIGLLLTDISPEEWGIEKIQLVTHSHQLKKFLPVIQMDTSCTQRDGSFHSAGKSQLKPACPSDCHRCITACPTSALSLGKSLDVNRCVSYLTQKPGELSPEEKTLIGNQLYGCDICQDVCPFNLPREKCYVDPQEWLAMDDTAFEEKYGHTGMLWQGAAILRRNAQVAVDNSNQ